jgi:hypothetical protein
MYKSTWIMGNRIGNESNVFRVNSKCLIEIKQGGFAFTYSNNLK